MPLSGIRSDIEITVESVEETVIVFVVENMTGRKLLCEQSLPARLLFPFFRVIYKMERNQVSRVSHLTAP